MLGDGGRVAGGGGIQGTEPAWGPGGEAWVPGEVV